MTSCVSPPANKGTVTDRLCSSMHLRIRYDVALLYLKQANYDLDIAVKNYLADEKWEREHPMKVTIKGTKSQSIIKRRLDFSQY